MQINKYIYQNLFLRILFILLILLSFLSANPLLTILSLLLFAGIIIFFWRPGVSFIFAFILLWQWLQVTIKIFYADLINVNINEVSDTGSSEKAILMSMLGLVSLAIGIYLAIRNLKPVTLSQLKEEAEKFSVNKIFITYIVFAILNSFISEIMFNYPRLTQILVALLNIKMMIVALLFMITLITQQEKKWMLIIIIIEVVMGFAQFFSGFKEVLYFVIITALTINYKIKPRLVFRYSLLLILIIAFSIIWLSVRTDYRDFLNKGTGQQVVLVPFGQRMNQLTNLSSALSAQDIDDAMELAVFRTSYTDIFGQVIDRVPEYTSFEDGYILYTSFLHVITPRFLFPNKKIIYDSEKTNYYTGRNYATHLKGTSVGLGYMAEFYIDFGYLMIVPIFLLGYFYGYIYKIFVNNIKISIVAYAMIIPMLMKVALFETTHDKLIGGLLSSFIVLFLIYKFFLNRFLKLIRK